MLCSVHPPFTLVGFSWNDMSRIERLCQSVYLPFQPASPGSTALMHGLIYFILRDLMHDNDPIVEQHDCVSYLNFCEQRFSNSLSTYEVLSIPTLENIQILLLGVSAFLGSALMFLKEIHRQSRLWKKATDHYVGPTCLRHLLCARHLGSTANRPSRETARKSPK